MLKSKLTLQKLRARGIDAELLYGALDFFAIVVDAFGVSQVQDLMDQIKGGVAMHPCEHAMQLMVDVLTPVLEGSASWAEAKEYLDRLASQQNSN
jgi:hypothetical protein